MNINSNLSIYTEIVSFLKEKGIAIKEVESIGFSRKGNLKITFLDKQIIAFSDYPIEWKNYSFNIDNEIVNWVIQNKNEINKFINKNFCISNKIKVSFDYYASFYKIRFHYFNKIFEKNFSYTSLINKILFVDNKIDLEQFKTNFINDLQALLDELIDEAEMKNVLIKFYEKDFIKMFEQELQKIYKKSVIVKDNTVQILFNKQYFKVNIKLDNLFKASDFKFKKEEFLNTKICSSIEVKEKILEMKAKEIFSLEKGKACLSFDEIQKTMYFNMLNELNSKTNKLYSSLSYHNINGMKIIVLYDGKNFILKSKNKDFSAIQKNNKLEVSYINNKEKYCYITSSKYQNCCNFLEQELRGITLSYKSGEGLLFGNTCVTTEKIDFNFELPSVTESMTKWKLAIKKNINNLRKEVEEAERKDYENLMKIAPKLYGSILCSDIYSFVKLNESYVTENALIQSLRGLNVRLEAEIKPIPHSGYYNLITSEEIEFIVDLMIKNNFLYRKELKGYYGRFYVLKTNDKKKVYKPIINTKNIYTRIKDNQNLCYYELEYLIKKENKNQSDYIGLLNGIQNKEFLCFYKDEYIDLMRSIESYKMLFKMKYDSGFYEDKFLKKIVKEIITK